MSTAARRTTAAAIVLAGGRSSRMGSPKASLEWHGSSLLRRVTGIVARSLDGPVIVVRAPRQPLPELGGEIEIVADAREGRGPLEGLAAGLEAIGARADVAYVTSTDVPLLHPAFVRRVVGSLTDEFDVVLPEIGAHRQPLAAAYRVELLGSVRELIAADRMRPAFLFERCRVRQLTAAAILRDPALALVDPELDSVRNLNEPADYARAHELPAPEIAVERAGTLAPAPGARPAMVSAWSLGEAAASAGLTLGERILATVNGGPLTSDPQFPLAVGDRVAFIT